MGRCGRTGPRRTVLVGTCLGQQAAYEAAAGRVLQGAYPTTLERLNRA